MESHSASKKLERIIVACLSLFVVVLGVAIFSFVKLGSARKVNAAYDEYIEQLTEEKQELEENLDNITSSSYLEEIARNQYGMIYDNEEIYIFDK